MREQPVVLSVSTVLAIEQLSAFQIAISFERTFIHSGWVRTPLSGRRRRVRRVIVSDSRHRRRQRFRMRSTVGVVAIGATRKHVYAMVYFGQLAFQTFELNYEQCRRSARTRTATRATLSLRTNVLRSRKHTARTLNLGCFTRVGTVTL
jgi:hypothetical protein